MLSGQALTKTLRFVELLRSKSTEMGPTIIWGHSMEPTLMKTTLLWSVTLEIGLRMGFRTKLGIFFWGKLPLRILAQVG